MNTEIRVVKTVSGPLTFQLVDATTENVLAEITDVSQIEQIELAMVTIGESLPDIAATTKRIKEMAVAEGLPAPPEWKHDKLSQLISAAQYNTRVSFHNYQKDYKRVARISDALEKVFMGIKDPEDIASCVFFMQAHSVLLASVQLALSKQLPSAYMTIRGCLEDYVYGFYFSKQPDKFDVWAKRHQGEQERRECKRQITWGGMTAEIKNYDEGLSDEVRHLYEHSIDFGAHPNNLAMAGGLKDNGHSVTVEFFHEEPLAAMVCLKTIARVGFAGLLLMEQVLPKRFAELNLRPEIESLGAELQSMKRKPSSTAQHDATE